MPSSGINFHNMRIHQCIYPQEKRIYGHCKFCNKELTSRKVFCNSSCSAKSSNSLRPIGHYSRVQGNESRSKKLKKVVSKKQKNRLCYTKISQCIVCKKWFSGKRKTCSDSCLHTRLIFTANTKNKHFRPANRTMIEYKGNKLGSLYELEVCKSLDDNGIKWIIPTHLKYTDIYQKTHRYYPDLYLPDYNIYLDPKNDYLINNPNPYHGYKDTDKIKWVELQNNVRILILDKNNLNWNSIKKLVGLVGIEPTRISP